MQRGILQYVYMLCPPPHTHTHTHYCYLDQKYETVVLPMHGTATPFHISTIKVHIATSILNLCVFVMYFFNFPRISVAVKKETMSISE